METQPTIDKQQFADDFAASVKESMPQDQIDAAVKTMMAETQGYSANGSITGFIFYFRITVQVTDTSVPDKQFTGNAGGIGSAGGGALIGGTVYTSDINGLYANTVSFQYNATPVAVNVNFFDKNSNLLGYFFCAAVSTIASVGGGSGSWS